MRGAEIDKDLLDILSQSDARRSLAGLRRALSLSRANVTKLRSNNSFSIEQLTENLEGVANAGLHIENSLRSLKSTNKNDVRIRLLTDLVVALDIERKALAKRLNKVLADYNDIEEGMNNGTQTLLNRRNLAPIKNDSSIGNKDSVIAPTSKSTFGNTDLVATISYSSGGFTPPTTLNIPRIRTRQRLSNTNDKLSTNFMRQSLNMDRENSRYSREFMEQQTQFQADSQRKIEKRLEIIADLLRKSTGGESGGLNFPDFDLGNKRRRGGSRGGRFGRPGLSGILKGGIGAIIADQFLNKDNTTGTGSAIGGLAGSLFGGPLAGALGSFVGNDIEEGLSEKGREAQQKRVEDRLDDQQKQIDEAKQAGIRGRIRNFKNVLIGKTGIGDFLSGKSITDIAAHEEAKRKFKEAQNNIRPQTNFALNPSDELPGIVSDDTRIDAKPETNIYITTDKINNRNFKSMGSSIDSGGYGEGSSVSGGVYNNTGSGGSSGNSFGGGSGIGGPSNNSSSLGGTKSPGSAGIPNAANVKPGLGQSISQAQEDVKQQLEQAKMPQYNPQMSPYSAAGGEAMTMPNNSDNTPNTTNTYGFAGVGTKDFGNIDFADAKTQLESNAASPHLNSDSTSKATSITGQDLIPGQKMTPQQYFGTEDLSNMGAGMRNNNPGNLKYTGSKWQRENLPGLVGPSVNTDQGDPQAVFDSPLSGMQAATKLAMTKYNSGMTTVRSFITTPGKGWTPGYTAGAEAIAKRMGIGVDDDINLKDPESRKKFMKALVQQEQSDKYEKRYNDDLYNAGTALDSDKPKAETSKTETSKAETNPSNPNNQSMFGSLDNTNAKVLGSTAVPGQLGQTPYTSSAFDNPQAAKDYLRTVSAIGSSSTMMKNAGFDSIDNMNNEMALKMATAMKNYNDNSAANGLTPATLNSGARFPVEGMVGGMVNKNNSMHAGGLAADVGFNRMMQNYGPNIDKFAEYAKKEGLNWGKDIYGGHEGHHFNLLPGKTNPFAGEYNSDGTPKDPEKLKNYTYQGYTVNNNQPNAQNVMPEGPSIPYFPKNATTNEPPNTKNVPSLGAMIKENMSSDQIALARKEMSPGEREDQEKIAGSTVDAVKNKSTTEPNKMADVMGYTGSELSPFEQMVKKAGKNAGEPIDTSGKINDSKYMLEDLSTGKMRPMTLDERKQQDELDRLSNKDKEQDSYNTKIDNAHKEYNTMGGLRDGESFNDWLERRRDLYGEQYGRSETDIDRSRKYGEGKFDFKEKQSQLQNEYNNSNTEGSFKNNYSRRLESGEHILGSPNGKAEYIGGGNKFYSNPYYTNNPLSIGEIKALYGPNASASGISESVPEANLATPMSGSSEGSDRQSAAPAPEVPMPDPNKSSESGSSGSGETTKDGNTNSNSVTPVGGGDQAELKKIPVATGDFGLNTLNDKDVNV